jgi:hypothetical protein
VSRRRDPGQLADRLAAETEVPVDVASARRDVPAGHRSGQRAWHVSWLDGPTVAGMRAKADCAAGEAGFDPAELVYAGHLGGRARWR